MPGTTNFLQFNPMQANQETDAEYVSDSTRTDGAGVGAIFPSMSANKTLYQVTTMTAALGQMLANKGFSVSDASYSALVAQLANILTTADQQGGLQNLAWSSVMTLNAAAFSAFAIPLQGPTALALDGVVAGRLYTMLYIQNGSGGWGITFGSGFGPTASQPTSTAGSLSAQIFLADAALTLRPVAPLFPPAGGGPLQTLSHVVSGTIPAGASSSDQSVSLSLASINTPLTCNWVSTSSGSPWEGLTLSYGYNADDSLVHYVLRNPMSFDITLTGCYLLFAVL